jgi:hypothetical protein
VTIALTKTGASALYQPQHAAAADRLAFLAAAAGGTIALADCWANRGAPPVAGYFVLMDRQADAAEAAAVEKLLFSDSKGPKLPPKPEANGLVWLRLGGGNAPAIDAVATAKLDTTNDPVVSADTIISDVPRVLGFGTGAPIAGTAGQGGDWLSLTVVSPSIAAHGLQPPSAPCTGPAISIDLSLANAGQLTFRALVDSLGNTEAVKALIHVLVDPVSPFNTTETFAGLNYALVEDSTGIHLRAAG